MMPKSWFVIGKLRIRISRISAYKAEGVVLRIWLIVGCVEFDCGSEDVAESLVRRLDELVSPSPSSNLNLN